VMAEASAPWGGRRSLIRFPFWSSANSQRDASALTL
jgi:hypothetical protein